MSLCVLPPHWVRELLALGHTVKLMPAHYLKPYVKRQKSDTTDAAAICEAVTRPSMRFVPPKSEEQQAVLVLHRSRELLVRQHTMLVSALKAHPGEFGVVRKQGKVGTSAVAALVENVESNTLSLAVRQTLLPLVEQLRHSEERVARLDQPIVGWQMSSPTDPETGIHTRHRPDHGAYHCGNEHRCPTLRILPHGFGLSHGRNPVEANSVWVVSPSRMMATSSSSWSSALTRFCGLLGKAARTQQGGRAVTF